MHKIAIPHGAYVLVGDGRKALFLRNEGDQKFPNLKAERVVVDENPRGLATRAPITRVALSPMQAATAEATSK